MKQNTMTPSTRLNIVFPEAFSVSENKTDISYPAETHKNTETHTHMLHNLCE